MTNRPYRSSAFTVIELLVVLAIIGLLAGLLIPAVLSSRAAAQQAECQNRLKQIGLALAAHESNWGYFPAGMRPETPGKDGRVQAKGPLSAQLQLLPFLEQLVLFNATNLSPGPPLYEPIATCPANATVASVRLAVFLCPADGGSGPRPGSNYRACNGSQPGEFDDSPFPGGGGAFTALKYLSSRDLTDGLSHTAGFSERLIGGGDARRLNGARDIWFSGLRAVISPVTNDTLFKFCDDTAPDGSDFWPDMGATWIAASYADTLYNHVAPPNWSKVDCGADLQSSHAALFSAGIVTARSLHRSCVNLLTMDGSVQPVLSSINLKVWRALGTRAGQEANYEDR